jgi:hypothetical protein
MADLHLIPNLCLARISQRHIVLLFFPALWSQHVTNSRDTHQFTPQELGHIYDDCIRPALLHVAATDTGHIPASYADELFRIQNPRGGFSYGTLDVPRHKVNSFGRKLTYLLQAKLPFAKDCFYVHQVRGTRAASTHVGDDNLDRHDALIDWVDWASEQDDTTSWYVDVGLELRMPGKCLQWRQDAHQALMQHVLVGESHTAIQRMRGPTSHRYTCDVASSIEELAGFRCEPRRLSGAHCVKYINCYTTDKHVMYHPQPGGRHYSKFVTTSKLMACAPDAPNLTIAGMFAALHNAATEVDGHARIEMRIPLDEAVHTFLSLPSNLIRNAVVVYDRQVWW